jgi:hypothetical protein
MMDVWVELTLGGKVHVVLEYEPMGLDPEVSQAPWHAFPIVIVTVNHSV